MGTGDCGHICGESSPGVGEAGRTGEWRASRPVLDRNKCTPARRGVPACFLCWLYCPEAVMTKSLPPDIDLGYCKGCGICAQVCPTHAIDMVDESSFEC